MNNRQNRCLSFVPVLLALTAGTAAVAAEPAAATNAPALPAPVQPASAEAAPAALLGMVPEAGRLCTWLQTYRMTHPRYLAQLDRADRASLLLKAADLQFRSPALSAAAGRTEDPSGVPHTTFSRVIDANSNYAGAGVEAPLVRGVYGGVGALVYSDATGEAESDSAETGLGAMLRIPLLRDRAFALNALEMEQLSFDEAAQLCAVQKELIDISAEIVKQYAQWLLEAADAAEIEKAMTRAEKLLEQSTERVRLKDLAQYQIYPARYEATLRREELESARQSIRTQSATLAQALGLAQLPGDMPDNPELLLRWADALAQLDIAPLAALDLEQTSPTVRRAHALAQSAAATTRHTAEDLRDELNLNLSAGWRSEADTDSGNDTGYTVALIFRRNLFSGGDEARIEADAAEARALQRDYENTLLTERIARERALVSFTNACARLQTAHDAVLAASDALSAEDDRFALGDGSSRSVLDAQQDLTSATRRQISVAGEVVSAMAELLRTVGRLPDEPGAPAAAEDRPAAPTP